MALMSTPKTPSHLMRVVGYDVKWWNIWKYVSSSTVGSSGQNPWPPLSFASFFHYDVLFITWWQYKSIVWEKKCGEITGALYLLCSHLCVCLCLIRKRLQNLVWGCAALRSGGKLPGGRTAPATWGRQSLTLEKTPRLERTRPLVWTLLVKLTLNSSHLFDRA